MADYTSSGPESGPILDRDHYGVIRRVGRTDKPRTIGRAREVGRTAGGVTLRKSEVRGDEVPGRRIGIGRESRPAHELGRSPSA